MRRPVEEVYKLKQRVMARLRETMAEHPAVKTWRSSVL
jgi:RNA polymerase primary sigma factor